jgi:hypothetical protein
MSGLVFHSTIDVFFVSQHPFTPALPPLGAGAFTMQGFTMIPDILEFGDGGR